MSDRPLNQKKRWTFYNVRDLYVHQHLPVDGIDEQIDFTIQDLKDIHIALPYSSVVFRPNFFSFVFVKDAFGRYTIDQRTFDVVPGTIYFTNPGHFKSYVWDKINETCLITLSESFLKKHVHSEVFEEFPFLLAETVDPRILHPEAFAEFEDIYTQISKEYLSHNPYRDRVIGKLFIILLLRFKEHFWNDYVPVVQKNSWLANLVRSVLDWYYLNFTK